MAYDNVLCGSFCGAFAEASALVVDQVEGFQKGSPKGPSREAPSQPKGRRFRVMLIKGEHSATHSITIVKAQSHPFGRAPLSNLQSGVSFTGGR